VARHRGHLPRQFIGLGLLLALILGNTARVEAERQAVTSSCQRANRYFRRTINQNIVRPIIDFSNNILETRIQEAMVAEELARVATGLGAPSAGALFHRSALVYRGAVKRDIRNIKEFQTVPYARCGNAFGSPPHPPYLRHAPLPKARRFHLKASTSPPHSSRSNPASSAGQAGTNPAPAPPVRTTPAAPAGATTSSPPPTPPEPSGGSGGVGNGGSGTVNNGGGGNPGGGRKPPPQPPPAPPPNCLVNAAGICIPDPL
jgi:hypothetical protein